VSGNAIKTIRSIIESGRRAAGIVIALEPGGDATISTARGLIKAKPGSGVYVGGRVAVEGGVAFAVQTPTIIREV
jgi:hypothetical protein